VRGVTHYFVFVRFFLGYSDLFPFDRFVRLQDAEIAVAVESLRDEWWGDSANRSCFVEAERVAMSRPRPTATARPGNNQHLPRQFAPTPPPRRTAHRGVPSFPQVARFARWWDGTTFGDSGYGISRPHTVARFDKKTGAETAATALQVRAVQTRIDAAERWKTNDDMGLATANARFAAVPESELSEADRIIARAQLVRIHQPVGMGTLVEEALLRLYWPHLFQTLEEAEARFNPLPTLDATKLAVLRFLGKTAPRLVLNADIEAGAELGKQAVVATVLWLIEKNLAVRPNGPRKGTTITDEGRQLLAKMR
jgi:hypothetical protein